MSTNDDELGDNDLAKEPPKSWRPRGKPFNIVKNVTEKEVLDYPLYIRVTDRDSKTDLVIGRIWRQHYYKINTEGTKLTCYLSLASYELPELNIDLTKLNSKDIIESDQLSEPENSKFVWSILPLKLLFASSSKEERTTWLYYLHSKINNPNLKNPNPESLSLSPSSETSSPLTETNLLPKYPSSSQAESNSPPSLVSPPRSDTSLLTPETIPPRSISIVLRRFNKRGGVRVTVPDSMDKLLKLATDKLKIPAVKIREVNTEAEIYEIHLLQPDMLVWVMTKKEELEFQ